MLGTLVGLWGGFAAPEKVFVYPAGGEAASRIYR
jgi:hypothetical protein